MFCHDSISRTLLCAALAMPCALSAQAVTTYGAGTPGSGSATPALWCNSTPRPGNANFALDIEDGLGGAPAIAFMSASRADLDLSGLRVLVDLVTGINLGAAVLSGSGAGNGSATLAAPLPNLPVLNGLPLHFQTYVLDAGGAWIGLSATQGLTCTSRADGALFCAPNTRVSLPMLSVSTFTTGLQSNNALALSGDGSRLFVAGRGSNNTRPVLAYDATSASLPSLGSFSIVDTATAPWTMTVTPGDRYLYVTNQGPSSTTPKIEAFYLDSARFGQRVPGPFIDPGSISTVRIVFNRPGTRGYVSTLGIGGSPSVIEYDTVIGGTNQHKLLRRVDFSGKFVWDAQLSPDDNMLYVSAASLGSFGEIRLVNARTMREVDWDTGAPGIQGIGGEVSRAKTPLGRVSWSVAVGPRHRYLYITVSGSVAGPARLVRVNVQPSHADYQKFVVYTTQIGASDTLGNVLVSPAGDEVYLSVRNTKRLHVLDATASGMTLRRVLTLGASPNEMAYR